MAEDIRKLVTRSFNKIEMLQIEELKVFMLSAFDANSWNYLRDEAKEIWPEKIISAVDGCHKWHITYNKATKSVVYSGVKF